MSEENIEVVRQLADAVNRGDVEAFVALCSPDVDWEENIVVFPGLRRRYRGSDEVREWFNEAFVELWQEFRIELGEMLDAPDGAVVAGGRLVGRGRSSGIETMLSGYWVLWLQDGKVIRRQVFLDRAEALEAAGLSE